MTQSTISYNVNGVGTPHPDVLEKHISKIQPRWLLVMDNIGMAQDYRRKFPNTNIVARNWGLTGGDENTYSKLSPAEWLDARLSEASDGIYLYTGNEAGIAVKWHIELMKLIIERNLKQVKLVICNCAVGTPADVTEWTQNVMREFFQLLDEHRDQFVLGLHEYFCGIAPSGFVGGYPDGTWKDGRTNLHPNYEDRSLWPPDATLLGMLWHCGRFKVVNDAARSFGYQPPRILITEHGADDLSDVAAWAKQFPLPDGYSNHRAWKTLGPMWAKLLPGRSPQQAFFENVNYLKTAVYSHFPNIEGQLVFTWTSKAEWNQFDMSEAAEFMSLLETSVSNEQPAPLLPAFPSDFDTRAKSYMLRASGNGSTIVRVRPYRQSTSIALIPTTPSIIKLIDAADLRPDERVQETLDGQSGVWLPVMIGSTKGWAFNAYLDVQPVIVAPPPPVELPELVKWQVVISCEGTPQQRLANRQMWSAIDTFLKQGLIEVQPTQAIQVKDVP